MGVGIGDLGEDGEGVVEGGRECARGDDELEEDRRGAFEARTEDLGVE